MDNRVVLGWPTWIGVVVENLGHQRRFWGDLLGRSEATSGPDYVQFEMGQGLSFELIERSDRPEYERPRFQVGFAVEDIERVRGELIRRGVEPVTEIVAGSDSSWAYFRDPEGNVFEVTSGRDTGP